MLETESQLKKKNPYHVLTLWGELRSYFSALHKHHRFSYKLAEKQELQNADVLTHLWDSHY